MRFSELLDREEPAFEAFSLALDAVFDEGDGCTEHIGRLSKEACLVYLLWYFDGEIHNGGFDQLFFNPLGDHCPEILTRLLAIGANNSQHQLKQAMAWFPNSSPAKDHQERWDQREKFREKEDYLSKLDSLDKEFYENKHNLTSLLNDYVKSNQNATIKG